MFTNHIAEDHRLEIMAIPRFYVALPRWRMIVEGINRARRAGGPTHSKAII